MSEIVQNRYGISALSKSHKQQAVANEIMIDKSTGEIQVKSTDKNIVSYNYMTRFNSHVNNFTFSGVNADIYGNIYEIEIPKFDLPCTVTKETNLLDSSVPISTSTLKSFMISIDVECIKHSTKLSKLNTKELQIELEFEYYINSSKSVVRISDTLSNLNERRLCKSDFSQNLTSINLSYIKILNDSSYNNTERFILHSVLINIED